MKFTKRLLTIALSMGMVMPLCATAYAAPTVTINSATISPAEDNDLYDVTVTFTVANSSQQVALLLTGPNADNDGPKVENLNDNDIVHINQFGKNNPDEAKYFQGTGTCEFSVSKERMKTAGAMDKTTGAIDGLWVSMSADDATEAASVQAVYSTSTDPDDPSPEFVLGDANGDGEVTVKDYTVVFEHAIGRVTIDENDKRFKAADVNGDGEVTVKDYTGIFEYIIRNKPFNN